MGESTASCILRDPDLYLGGDIPASSKEFIKGKKIGAVLNCTPEVKNYFIGDDVEYSRVSVGDSRDDDDMEKMNEILKFAAEWIHLQRDVFGRNVYVHCNQGINRSASCVAAYLIRYKGMTYKDVRELFTLTRQAAFYHGAYATFHSLLENFA